MSGYDLKVDLGDISMDASAAGPEPAAGFLVALHGAAEPSRDFFLYAHLASVVPQTGWSVVRYDRRPSIDGVPLERQVADATSVVQTVHRSPGWEGAPVGLWGFSQGAWTATLAASAIPGVVGLILVGYSAVTPSRQMRFATANYLRSAGYGPAELRSLAELRAVCEDYYRGAAELDHAQSFVDRYRNEPWFDLAYVPDVLPPRESIDDPGFFDFEPSSALAEIDVPTLIFYGDDDADVPVDESIAVIEGLERDRTSIRRLPGSGHDLTRREPPDVGDVEPRYASELVAWIERELPGAGHAPS